jgi:predicted O-methyltransferase YrrM
MPGGFLLVARAAVQAVADASTEYVHHMAGMQYPTKHVFDLVLRDGVLLGEDVIFAQRLAAAGFELWVDPDMSFAHVGAMQWRGNLAEALRRGYADNPPLDGRAVRSLATAGTDELAEPVDALFREWGNSWAMPPAELIACAVLAKRSNMILEAGAGLSSLVMAAANPGARVHTLESDPVWCERIINEARRHGLGNLTVHLTPLDSADWFYTIPADLPAGPYDLAVIDGPVFLNNTHLAHSTDTRRPAYTKLAGRLAGAVLVVDDCEHYRDILAGYVHEEVGGRFAICLPNAAAEAAA